MSYFMIIIKGSSSSSVIMPSHHCLLPHQYPLFLPMYLLLRHQYLLIQDYLHKSYCTSFFCFDFKFCTTIKCGTMYCFYRWRNCNFASLIQSSNAFTSIFFTEYGICTSVRFAQLKTYNLLSQTHYY